MKVILTEKPSVAVDIAKSLGKFDRKDGYIEAGDYIVTWAYGHLLEIDNSIVPRRWSADDLPLFPEFRYKVIKSSGKQFSVIKNLLGKADSIIIATDAGREGELIARLILLQAGWKGWDKTYRLWTSEALTPEVVRRELKNLKPAEDFNSLYWSALARQHADWIVGINLTRLVTLKSSDRSVWSVGRVQTPTLNLIAKRDAEIENFKPQPYWVIKALFSKEGEEYEGWLLVGDEAQDTDERNEGEEDREEDRNFRLSKDKALLILKELEKEKWGSVLEVRRQKKSEKPPLLHSLTSLQREANRMYGFSAKKTLDIAQRLYQDYKVLSYPRTDAQHLGTSNRELVKKILRKLGKEELIERVDAVGRRVFDDSKLTDHHAIIPLAPLPPNIREDERKIYELVLRKFIGAFMPDYEYETTTVITRLGRYSFLTKGKRDINLGWKVLYREKEKESKLPQLHEEDRVLRVKVEGEERKTKPPARYTEGSLLKVMEKLGLGTPATRADIINTLLERGYVVRKGKSLVTTLKGKELMDKLKDSHVSSPEMTAGWEKELEAIYTLRKGRDGYERFLEGIKEFVKNEIDNLKGREFNAPRQATDKMFKLARSLAKETGLRLPEDTDFETIKSFIDKALKEKERQLAEGIGQCKCGGKVTPFSKGWKCSACGAVVWTTMYGKRISKNLALKLLKGEKVYVKGLKSKSGKHYSAYMYVDGGKVKLEFGA